MKKQVNLRLDQEIYKQAKVKCTESDLSMGLVVDALLTAWTDGSIDVHQTIVAVESQRVKRSWNGPTPKKFFGGQE